MQSDDERALVLAGQRGEVHAFARLVRLYQDAALRSAYLLTNDRQAAEDIVQNAFLNAFRHLHRCDPARSFRAWFFGILTNEAKMYRRGQRRHPAGWLDPQLPAHDDSLDDQVAAMDERARVRQALLALDEPFRSTAVLYYVNDLTVDEIASALGCRVGTVKSRLHTARDRLRALLLPTPTMPTSGTSWQNREDKGTVRS